MTIYTIRPATFPGIALVGCAGGPYLRFVDMRGAIPAGAHYNTLPEIVKGALGQYFEVARGMSREERHAAGPKWKDSSFGVDVTVADRPVGDIEEAPKAAHLQ